MTTSWLFDPDGAGAPSFPSPQNTSLPDERGQRSRDRVLLFLRGMDLPPLESVDLARESLSRSGPQADPADAMRALRALLAERGLAHSAQNSRGERLMSAPPMNRHPMIAEDLTPRSRLAALLGHLKRGAPASVPPSTPIPEGERHG